MNIFLNAIISVLKVIVERKGIYTYTKKGCAGWKIYKSTVTANCAFACVCERVCPSNKKNTQTIDIHRTQTYVYKRLYWLLL